MTVGLVPSFCGIARADAYPSGIFNVRSFGARGDGVALDTPAIDAAIDAAAAAGGGAVVIPAGTYRSVTVHLRSHVVIDLEPGAILAAAVPGPGVAYDAPEPNSADQYQDFGHSHWRNSLISGDGLEDIGIVGSGEIRGDGLVRDYDQSGSDANKAIALRNCRRVTLRDVTIAHGGWFAILATGVDDLTIDKVRIDTNRDGMDIDCCKNVHIENCTVNSPRDDAISRSAMSASTAPRRRPGSSWPASRAILSRM